VEPVGIIAGTGNLPLYVARHAGERGYRVVVIAFPGFTDPSIERFAHETEWMKPGRLQKAINALKSRGIRRVVMAGKMEKINLLRPWNLGLDRRAIRLIRRIKDWRDDTLLRAIAEEFLSDGLLIEEITDWAGRLMAPEGVLTKRAPTAAQWKDVEFGRRMAQGIGSLDIGQTVVVKNAAVIVVEAIEGTDKAIRRTADLGIRDAVVVKMAKPQQDMRFDVPGVGPSTIDSMVAARAGVLAVEAGKTMISDIGEMIEKADKAKISVVGVSPNGSIG
jgi:UDP-2,3-diacylglucosamine hydrolase